MPAPFEFIKQPLVKEIGLILVIKLALLTAIWSVWFAHPAPSTSDSTLTGQHLLGPSLVPVTEVTPR